MEHSQPGRSYLMGLFNGLYKRKQADVYTRWLNHANQGLCSGKPWPELTCTHPSPNSSLIQQIDLNASCDLSAGSGPGNTESQAWPSLHWGAFSVERRVDSQAGGLLLWHCEGNSEEWWPIQSGRKNLPRDLKEEAGLVRWDPGKGAPGRDYSAIWGTLQGVSMTQEWASGQGRAEGKFSQVDTGHFLNFCE